MIVKMLTDLLKNLLLKNWGLKVFVSIEAKRGRD